MSKENMRIWEVLGKTDPAHTKQFTRPGGFRGTAVKPMWANKQMTEFFGPCGIGWGMTEPRYETVIAGDEILVFCTAGLWYIQNGTKHGPVYGQGGDRVQSIKFFKDNGGQKVWDAEHGKFRTWHETDDEAFKKAYTDALSNAMKFIGVAADVHMGLFDDSKYVQEVRAEFEAEAKAAVIAEVEEQKRNPSKVELTDGKTLAAFAQQQKIPEVTPITLNDRLEASVRLEAEKRAAAERTALAEQQGIFSLDNDVLTCKIIGIQKKAMGPKTKTPGKEFRSVTFNGRLPNGANFASVFDTELYEALEAALDKECKLEIEVKGAYVNIKDVKWIAGVGASAPVFDYKHQEVSDGDIPF